MPTWETGCARLPHRTAFIASHGWSLASEDSFNSLIGHETLSEYQSRKDKSRDRKVAALGWQTLRITEEDVRIGLDGVMADLAAVIGTATTFWA